MNILIQYFLTLWREREERTKDITSVGGKTLDRILLWVYRSLILVEDLLLVTPSLRESGYRVFIDLGRSLMSGSVMELTSELSLGLFLTWVDLVRHEDWVSLTLYCL